MKLAGICFLLWPALTLAQAPPVAGTGATIKAGVGFEYLNLDVVPSSRVGLYGLDADITGDFFRRFGSTVDFGYVRVPNVLGTGHHSDVLSYLAGPVFYPTKGRKLSTYVRGLVGGARVTGVTPPAGSHYFLGYANKFAWDFGCGVEYRVSKSIAIRGGADYLRTAFFDPSTSIRGQNNLRSEFSFVYFFWQHPERRH